MSQRVPIFFSAMADLPIQPLVWHSNAKTPLLHLGIDEKEEDPLHVMHFTNNSRHWHEHLIDRGAIQFRTWQTCFNLGSSP